MMPPEATSPPLTRKLRYPLRSGDAVFFLHIPKTAGTSFYATLASQFPPESVCPFSYHGLKKHLQLAPSESVTSYRLLAGHHEYRGVCAMMWPRHPVIVTMLREPIARTISTYEHIGRSVSHDLHADVAARYLDIVAFLAEPGAPRRFYNRQTRQLVGVVRDPAAAARFSESDLLTMAKIRLHQFAFFGLTERYDDSLRLLAYTFGWALPPARVLNAAPAPARAKRAELPDATLAAVAAANRLDLALYEFAAELFEERVRAMDAALGVTTEA